MKALEREVRELRQANEILRKASAYFGQAELERQVGQADFPTAAGSSAGSFPLRIAVGPLLSSSKPLTDQPSIFGRAAHSALD